MDLEKMGKFIAKLRTDKGLTQAQLGELLGVENKIISKWEKGINTPDVMMLIALSNVFNVRVEEIVDGEYKEKYRKEENREISIIDDDKYRKHIKIRNIIISVLVIILLINLALFTCREIKEIKSKMKTDTITIDLKNDPETPLNVTGCIMSDNNSTMYVIKSISYETKGEDKVGKTLIVQYEVKLLVDDKMVGIYTHNFDSNKELDDAIDNLAFTVESGKEFNKNSKVKIQVKYTTISSDKGVTETDLFV